MNLFIKLIKKMPDYYELYKFDLLNYLYIINIMVKAIQLIIINNRIASHR